MQVSDNRLRRRDSPGVHLVTTQQFHCAACNELSVDVVQYWMRARATRWKFEIRRPRSRQQQQHRNSVRIQPLTGGSLYTVNKLILACPSVSQQIPPCRRAYRTARVTCSSATARMPEITPPPPFGSTPRAPTGIGVDRAVSPVTYNYSLLPPPPLN